MSFKELAEKIYFHVPENKNIIDQKYENWRLMVLQEKIENCKDFEKCKECKKNRDCKDFYLCYECVLKNRKICLRTKNCKRRI